MLWMLAAAPVLIIALGQPAAELAAETRGGNDITVSANETVDDDLYAFGGNVTILGNVTGSVIAGGNNVTISAVSASGSDAMGWSLMLLAAFLSLSSVLVGSGLVSLVNRPQANFDQPIHTSLPILRVLTPPCRPGL
jgi:hypothetical protein